MTARSILQQYGTPTPECEGHYLWLRTTTPEWPVPEVIEIVRTEHGLWRKGGAAVLPGRYLRLERVLAAVCVAEAVADGATTGDWGPVHDSLTTYREAR